MKVFQNAVERLIHKGFSPLEAKAIVATIRAAEDFHLATELQEHVNKQHANDGTLGNKVARIFRYEDVSYLIKQASVNAPSPNQMPSLLAGQTEALSTELFRLQEKSTTNTEAVTFLINQLNDLEQLTK